MLQIVFDHLIGHLTNGGAKITARPKMSSPVSLLQVRKLLEQIARSPSLNPPPNFAGGPIRRSTDQNVDMIFAHHAFYNPYLKRFTGLAHQVSYSLCYFTTRHFVTILGYPNKIAAKAGGLNLMIEIKLLGLCGATRYVSPYCRTLDRCGKSSNVGNIIFKVLVGISSDLRPAVIGLLQGIPPKYLLVAM
jgi:hypothetical protein